MKFNPTVLIPDDIKLPALEVKRPEANWNEIQNHGWLFAGYPAAWTTTGGKLGEERIQYKARLSDLHIALGNAKAFLAQYAEMVNTLEGIIRAQEIN